MKEEKPVYDRREWGKKKKKNCFQNNARTTDEHTPAQNTKRNRRQFKSVTIKTKVKGAKHYKEFLLVLLSQLELEEPSLINICKGINDDRL